MRIEVTYTPTLRFHENTNGSKYLKFDYSRRHDNIKNDLAIKIPDTWKLIEKSSSSVYTFNHASTTVERAKGDYSLNRSHKQVFAGEEADARKTLMKIAKHLENARTEKYISEFSICLNCLVK